MTRWGSVDVDVKVYGRGRPCYEPASACGASGGGVGRLASQSAGCGATRQGFLAFQFPRHTEAQAEASRRFFAPLRMTACQIDSVGQNDAIVTWNSAVVTLSEAKVLRLPEASSITSRAAPAVPSRPVAGCRCPPSARRGPRRFRRESWGHYSRSRRPRWLWHGAAGRPT